MYRKKEKKEIHTTVLFMWQRWKSQTTRSRFQCRKSGALSTTHQSRRTIHHLSGPLQ